MPLSTLPLIGHGTPGLRSNLRDYLELLDASASRKLTYIELRPTLPITGWTLDESATYIATLDKSYDNVTRDIAAIHAIGDMRLVRQETLALCKSTAGSYFYDVDEQFSYPPFIWDQSKWDDGKHWDQFRRLYVHLTGGGDPNDTTVIAAFCLPFASIGERQPSLGLNKFTDGGLEAWTTSSDLTNWTEAHSGTGALAKEASDIKEGLYSAKLTVAANGDYAGFYQSKSTFVSGKLYRLSGYYKVVGGSAGAAKIIVSGGSLYLVADGRSTDASEQNIALDDTQGEWRRFVFDFIAPATTVEFRFRAVQSAAGALSVYYDDLRVQRVWRFNYYGPRISSTSIPVVSIGTTDIFFGGKQTGIGNVSLRNNDRFFDKLVGELEWINQEVIVRHGGRFGDESEQEILIEDTRSHLTGLIQSYELSDIDFALVLQDLRTTFNIKLPPSINDDAVRPNLNPAYQGKPRPLWFGSKTNITPIRIDKEPTYSKYGKYELADCDDAPNGIKSIDAIYAYLDETAAKEKDSTKRITLTSGTHYTPDLTLGRFTVLADIGPYEITTESNKLDFDEGSTAKVAALTVGLYTAAQLAALIQTQMRAVGSSDLNCTYSDVTNKITISKGAGTLNLKISTGANKEIACWSVIGFARGADKTGSLSYLADDAIFEDVDKEHVLRMNGKGFKDDASGTYTGTPSALIEIGSDICRVLFTCYLKRPAADIDETSFVFARARAPEALAVYLKTETSLRDIIDTLEFSNIANIVIDGEGKISYLVYVGDTPANITDFYDRDYRVFASSRASTDVYRTVRVRYNQDPSTDEWMARDTTDESVALRFGRPDMRVFETMIRIGDNAQAAANRLSQLANQPARKVRFSTTSKLIDKKVGDKIRLTRKRAMDVSGSLAGQVFRIIAIKKSPPTGECEVEAVDDVVTVAGLACISLCQRTCEQQCEGCGQTVCQETCQIDPCQIGCEVNPQGCGFTTCQETCMLSCMVCGEAGFCQSTCELASQGCGGGCEVECQVCGQAGHCQTTCEVACQQCGQAGLCEIGCEATCENCGQAGHCQVGCEVACQQCGQAAGPCQETCQLAPCQTACELGTCEQECQSVCQYPSEYI